MSDIDSNIDTVIFDIGSTYTKGVVYGAQGYMARAQAPTTVEDVEKGVKSVLDELSSLLQGHTFNPEDLFATSSAAGGLRMVAMGYMPRVTAKAAKEVSMASGAKILEIISNEESPEYRMEILKETAPDIILLAGGTDGGDEESLIDNARIIIESEIDAVVILAGNVRAQAEVEEILNQADYRVKCVPNVMPTIHQLNAEPAREAIHEEFIRQITRAPGLQSILNLITNDKVIPTPGSVLLAAELLARGTFNAEGLGNLIVIDLGGATTDIHSILPEMEEMETEEKGLVLTNEKQVLYRTVEGNLGLRVSARGIVDTVGEEYILTKIDREEKLDELKDYVDKISDKPEYIAKNNLEKLFDRALAISAIEVALKRHAGYISQEFDPAMGTVPGTPVGRDLRDVETIIGVGGIFAHLPEEEVEIIISEALSDPGISLLPEDYNLYWDQKYSLFSIGVLADNYPDQAFKWGLQQLREV
jgi:uncharacterized protein (TIGR01319 family)